MSLRRSSQHYSEASMSNPVPRSILDPRFKYIPSHKTDIRRTFRKARLLARIQARRIALSTPRQDDRNV